MTVEELGAAHAAAAAVGKAPIGVLLVIGVRLYREGLLRALGGREGLHILGATADAMSGLASVRALRPQVAVVDLAGPERVRFARGCARCLPNLRALALTASDGDEELVAVAEAGMSGYITHDTSLDALVDAIESAARGELVCPPRVAAALMRRVGTLSRTRPEPAASGPPLTARELEILELIDAGLSNKEIGATLHIELATVKNHVHNILEKLSVGRRAHAAARWREGSIPHLDGKR